MFKEIWQARSVLSARIETKPIDTTHWEVFPKTTRSPGGGSSSPDKKSSKLRPSLRASRRRGVGVVEEDASGVLGTAVARDRTTIRDGIWRGELGRSSRRSENAHTASCLNSSAGQHGGGGFAGCGRVERGNEAL